MAYWSRFLGVLADGVIGWPDPCGGPDLPAALVGWLGLGSLGFLPILPCLPFHRALELRTARSPHGA